MNTYLKKMRKKEGVSQEFLAKQLGLSRPTYIQLESWERKMLVEEAQKLALFFDLSLNDFLSEKEKKSPIIEIEKGDSVQNEPEMRISVPQKNIKKFKEVLLYILETVGAKSNIWETVIYKLLYFIDFDYYEKHEEQLIWATYIKNNYWPTPVEFKKVIEEMQKEWDVEMVQSKFFDYTQRKYLPLKKAVLSSLSAVEKEHIDEILNRSVSGKKLVDMNASEISAYSHGDLPWMSHKLGEKISYESVFYRNDAYSVKEYNDEL